MADDGISAVNEHDVPSAATDSEHPQTTGDRSVAPVASADSCAAHTSEGTSTSDVDAAGDDTPPSLRSPLLSVDDALRSIARPTPISIVAPVTRAAEAVTGGCRRLAPLLLPSGLTHALAIAVGCAIGWHTRSGDDIVPTMTADAGTGAADAVVFDAVDTVAFDPTDTVAFEVTHPVEFDAVDSAEFDAMNSAQFDATSTPAFDATGTGLVPFAPFELARDIESAGPVEAARPIEVRDAFVPTLGPADPGTASQPARVESRFAAPRALAPSRDVTPGTFTQRPAPAGALRPIEIPNDAVSLDAAESVRAAPAAVVPATATAARANPAAVITAPANPASVTAASVTAASVTAAPAVPVVGVMTYTADDLRRALVDAHEAIGCSHCKSTGLQAASEPNVAGGRGRLASHASRDGAKACSACGGIPAARFTSEGYESLCRLAEVATFVRVEADDTETWSVRDQSRHLLSVAIGERDRLNKTGRLAGFRLDDPARAHNGILLAGTVQRVSYLGSLYHSDIVLFGVPRRVTVISEREPPFGEGHRVVVLGAIVDRPVENLRGYQGEVQQVVWGGLPLVLSD